MKRYRYKAFRADGTAVTGRLSAPTAQAAADVLHERGYGVQRLREERRPLFFRRPFRGRRLALFCREWSSLLAAGLPMTETLAVLGAHGSRAAREALADISSAVASGQPLSEACRQSGAFPPFFLAMTAVGERSGALPEELDRLARYYEKEADLRRQFGAAVAYPLFLLSFAAAVFALVFTVILPSFSLLFDALGLPLPPLTRGALAFGLFLRDYGASLLVALFAGALALWAFCRTKDGRRRWEALLFRSRFVRRLFLIRFCSTVAALLQSGAPLSEALAAAETFGGNAEGCRRLRRARSLLSRGMGLAGSLQEARLAPPLLLHMTAAGTESGELPRFLREAARLMTEETARKLVRLKAILEPALLLAVGSLTAAVIFTVMIPIFTAVSRSW